jgi:SseB protein N-terminal domain
VSRYSDAVPELSGGDPRFRADHGEADPAVAAALTAFADGTGTERAALTALAAARLLVPVVAVTGEFDDGAEKSSEMATPSMVGADGRRALPAFTSQAALRRWQPAARPVPVPALGVWQSAARDSQAVIIDVAGPVPLAVEGARLAALAAGEPVPALHEDADVRAALAAVAAAQPAGVRIRLGPPRGAADFTIELAPADPAAVAPVPESGASAIAEELADRLAGRLAGGIAVVRRSPAGR